MTMGFPTKNDHFGVFWGYHHLRKHPYLVGKMKFKLLFQGPLAKWVMTYDSWRTMCEDKYMNIMNT